MVHEINREKMALAFSVLRRMEAMDALTDEYDDVFDEYWYDFESACDCKHPINLMRFTEAVVKYNPDVTDEMLFRLFTDVLGIMVV